MALAEGLTVNFASDLVTITCGGCFCTFAVPRLMYDRYRKSGMSLRCPNVKCSWSSFIQSEWEEKRLQRELAEANARAERAADSRRRCRCRPLARSFGHLWWLRPVGDDVWGSRL